MLYDKIIAALLNVKKAVKEKLGDDGMNKRGARNYSSGPYGFDRVPYEINRIADAIRHTTGSGGGTVDQAARDMIEEHTDNADIHVTASDKSVWSAKQAALTTAQQDAVNSGVTSTKVIGYDTHTADPDKHVTATQKNAWTTKQDRPQTFTEGDIAVFAATGDTQSGNKAFLEQESSTANKILATSTDAEVPTAKAVYKMGQEVVNQTASMFYQGRYLYGGLKADIEALDPADITALMTKYGVAIGGKECRAVGYEGTLNDVTAINIGVWDGAAWTWAAASPAPVNSMWFYVYSTLDKSGGQARGTVQNDGVNPMSIDIYLLESMGGASTPDGITIELNASDQLQVKEGGIDKNKFTPDLKTEFNGKADLTALEGCLIFDSWVSA